MAAAAKNKCAHVHGIRARGGNCVSTTVCSIVDLATSKIIR